VTVKAGTTVRWVNGDDVFHTITSTASLERRRSNGLFNASVFSRGQTFQRRFDRPGTFHYFCQPHSEFMAGTVRVE
jgi:plastocyanin